FFQITEEDERVLQLFMPKDSSSNKKQLTLADIILEKIRLCPCVTVFAYHSLTCMGLRNTNAEKKRSKLHKMMMQWLTRTKTTMCAATTKSALRSGFRGTWTQKWLKCIRGACFAS